MKITKVMKNAIAFFNIILIIALLCSCVGGDIHSATRLATPVVSINGEEVSWGTVSEADGYSIEINGIRTTLDKSITTYTVKNGDKVRVQALGNGSTHHSSFFSKEVICTIQSDPREVIVETLKSFDGYFSFKAGVKHNGDRDLTIDYFTQYDKEGLSWECRTVCGNTVLFAYSLTKEANEAMSARMLDSDGVLRSVEVPFFAEELFEDHLAGITTDDVVKDGDDYLISGEHLNGFATRLLFACPESTKLDGGNIFTNTTIRCIKEEDSYTLLLTTECIGSESITTKEKTIFSAPYKITCYFPAKGDISDSFVNDNYSTVFDSLTTYFDAFGDKNYSVDVLTTDKSGILIDSSALRDDGIFIYSKEDMLKNSANPTDNIVGYITKDDISKSLCAYTNKDGEVLLFLLGEENVENLLPFASIDGWRFAFIDNNDSAMLCITEDDYSFYKNTKQLLYQLTDSVIFNETPDVSPIESITLLIKPKTDGFEIKYTTGDYNTVLQYYDIGTTKIENRIIDSVSSVLDMPGTYVDSLLKIYDDLNSIPILQPYYRLDNADLPVFILDDHQEIFLNDIKGSVLPCPNESGCLVDYERQVKIEVKDGTAIFKAFSGYFVLKDPSVFVDQETGIAYWNEIRYADGYLCSIDDAEPVYTTETQVQLDFGQSIKVRALCTEERICSLYGNVAYYNGEAVPYLSKTQIAKLESRLCYDILGKMENGPKLQACYNAVDDVCYTFYSSRTLNVSRTDYSDCLAVDQFGLNLDEFLILLEMYKYDHPFYYWIDYNYAYTSTNYFVMVNADYYTAITREIYDLAVLRELDEYISLIDGVSNDYEKAMILHNKLLDDLIYCYENDGVTPEADIWAHSALGVFAFNEGVCETYTKAYSLLMNLAGIPCYTVLGKAGSADGRDAAGHVWNLVLIENEWYWVDATWNDSKNKISFGTEYFLVDDDIMDDSLHFVDASFSDYLPNRAEDPYIHTS